MNENIKKDSVNHPSHYISKSGLETIDVLRSFTEGLNGIEAVCTGNALKYLCRWKHKNGVEDLRKAVWYINYLIGYLEGPKEKIIPDALQEEIDKFINKMSNPTDVKYVVKVPEVWFTSKKKAYRYIQALHDIVNEKGYITVRDVKECAGIVPDTDDIRFGWTRIQTLTDDPDLGGAFKWRVTIVGRPVEITHELFDVTLEKQNEEKSVCLCHVPTFVFNSKNQAKKYVHDLRVLLHQKGYVTVRDAKERAGLSQECTDELYGWKRFDTVIDDVRACKDSKWRVDILGQLVELKEDEN